jgi:hypothetical protein
MISFDIYILASQSVYDPATASLDLEYDPCSNSKKSVLRSPQIVRKYV